MNIGSGQEIDIKTLTQIIAHIIGLFGHYSLTIRQTKRPAAPTAGLHAGIEGIRFHGKHAAGGGVTEDGGVVSTAERLESTSYGVLKSEKIP